MLYCHVYGRKLVKIASNIGSVHDSHLGAYIIPSCRGVCFKSKDPVDIKVPKETWWELWSWFSLFVLTLFYFPINTGKIKWVNQSYWPKDSILAFMFLHSHLASRFLGIDLKRDGWEMDFQKCYGTKVAVKCFASGWAWSTWIWRRQRRKGWGWSSWSQGMNTNLTLTSVMVLSPLSKHGSWKNNVFIGFKRWRWN